MSARKPSATLTAEELIEDLEFFAANGVGMIEAGKRLGQKVDAIEQRLRRHDRTDLLAALRALDPLAVPNSEVRRNRYSRWVTTPQGQAVLRSARRHLEHAREAHRDAQWQIEERRLVLLMDTARGDAA